MFFLPNYLQNLMQCQSQFQHKISQNLIPLILKLLMEMIEENEDDNNDSDSSTPHLSLLNPFLYIKDKQKVGCCPERKKAVNNLGHTYVSCSNHHQFHCVQLSFVPFPLFSFSQKVTSKKGSKHESRLYDLLLVHVASNMF